MLCLELFYALDLWPLELNFCEGAVTVAPGDVQSVSVGGSTPVAQRFDLPKWNCEAARLSVPSK